MPIIEYLCGACNHRYEKIVLSREEFDKAPGIEPCPKCGNGSAEYMRAPRTSAIFTPGGVGGFYKPSSS